MGMFSWSPGIKGAQVFFILSLKFFSVDPEKPSDGMAVGGAVIY
jgi:hypothetical protein